MKTRKLSLPSLLEAKIERFAKDHDIDFDDALLFLVVRWYHRDSKSESL